MHEELGMWYCSDGRYSKAAEQLSLGLQLATGIGDANAIASVHTRVAHMHLQNAHLVRLASGESTFRPPAYPGPCSSCCCCRCCCCCCWHCFYCCGGFSCHTTTPSGTSTAAATATTTNPTGIVFANAATATGGLGTW